jgi:hypothetical protein
MRYINISDLTEGQVNLLISAVDDKVNEAINQGLGRLSPDDFLIVASYSLIACKLRAARTPAL